MYRSLQPTQTLQSLSNTTGEVKTQTVFLKIKSLKKKKKNNNNKKKD